MDFFKSCSLYVYTTISMKISLILRPHGKILVLQSSFGIVYPSLIVIFNEKTRQKFTERSKSFWETIKSFVLKRFRNKVYPN